MRVSSRSCFGVLVSLALSTSACQLFLGGEDYVLDPGSGGSGGEGGATTTTSAGGGGTVNSLSVPARGRVVSTDETITVPAGTFRTYRTFVERDDLSTTETWTDLGTTLSVRQIDVTPSGTQTLEATTIR